MESFTQRMLKRAQLWREQQLISTSLTFSSFPDRVKLIVAIFLEEERSSNFNIFKQAAILCKDKDAVNTRPEANKFSSCVASYSTHFRAEADKSALNSPTDRKVENRHLDTQHYERCTVIPEECKQILNSKKSEGSEILHDSLKEEQQLLHHMKHANMNVNEIPEVYRSKNDINIRIGKEVLLAEEVCEIEENKDDINELPYKIEECVEVAQGVVVQNDSYKDDTPQLRYSACTSKSLEPTQEDNQNVVQRLKPLLCKQDTPTEMFKHLDAVQQQKQNLYEEVQKHHILKQQCSKAVAVCKTLKVFSSPLEYLEAERFLLLFSLKQEAAEQQMLHLENVPPENVGELNINTISFPLTEQFLGNDLRENCEYWFVCVGVQNTVVLATQVSSSIQEGEICFTEPLCFKKLPHSFSIKLMLFYTKLKKNTFSNEVKYHIPKEKKHLKFTVLLRHSRRSLYDLGDQTREMQNTTAFKLIATKTLRVSNIESTFCVDKVEIPYIIRGNVYLQLYMDITLNIRHTGFLDIMEEHRDLPTWERYWCRLAGYIFSYWKYPSDEDVKGPEGNVDLRASISNKVEPVDKCLCPRPRTLLLVTKREPLKGDCDSILVTCKPQLTLIRHLWSAANLQELTQWCTQINKVLATLDEWHLLKTTTLNQEVQITTVL